METIQPKLRFPEFKEIWEKKKLGEVSTNKSRKYNPLKDKENRYIKCIELEHLSSDSGQLLGFIDGSNSGSIKNKFEKGDVLFGKLRPYLKKYLLSPFEGVCTSEIWVLKGTKISNPFLYCIVQTGNFIDIANQSSGSKMPRADWNVVSNYEVNYPSLNEQTKIANFLSSVDEKLNLLKEKKSLLEEYKKGIMQKIFNQEIRFKDDNGNDFEDWEEKTLGSLCKITTGKLDANAMVEDGEYRFYTCAKDYYRIDKYAFDTEALLISGNGANVGYIHYYKGKFNAYQRTYILDRFEENMTYVKFFLQMFLPKRIKGEKNDGNTPYIVLSTLSEMEFSIPCIIEQTKIANFLSAINEKIELVANQIKDTQEYKKGLLQQMFV